MRKEKLTKKQRDFIQYYLETGNGVRAALKAYDTQNYMAAHSIASENLQKPAIKKFINDAMAELGFDDRYLFSLHRKLLESDNPSVVIRALALAYRLKGSFTFVKEPAYETLEERIKRRDLTIEDVIDGEDEDNV